MLPSQLMDFLRVIDKHAKKPTTVKSFDHCANGTGESEEKGRTDLGKTTFDKCLQTKWKTLS